MYAHINTCIVICMEKCVAHFKFPLKRLGQAKRSVPGGGGRSAAQFAPPRGPPARQRGGGLPSGTAGRDGGRPAGARAGPGGRGRARVRVFGRRTAVAQLRRRARGHVLLRPVLPHPRARGLQRGRRVADMPLLRPGWRDTAVPRRRDDDAAAASGRRRDDDRTRAAARPAGPCGWAAAGRGPAATRLRRLRLPARRRRAAAPDCPYTLLAEDPGAEYGRPDRARRHCANGGRPCGPRRHRGGHPRALLQGFRAAEAPRRRGRQGAPPGPEEKEFLAIKSMDLRTAPAKPRPRAEEPGCGFAALPATPPESAGYAAAPSRN